MNMEEKQYKIETIWDMVNCTNKENIDNFLIDLKNYLEMLHFLRETIGDDFDTEKYQPNGMTWIDDGKNDFTLTFKEKD